MKIINYSINKFITIISVFLLLFIFGLISLVNVPIQLVPTVEKPEISIVTSWSGASPEEIEREIIIRQEDKLKSLEGLESMESVSIEGKGTITLELNPKQNVSTSIIQVSNLLDQVKDIPVDADRPTIKSVSSERSPIAWFILKSKNQKKDIFKYKNFVEENIKTQFERIKGVGESGVRGGRSKEIHIVIDTNRIALAGLSLIEIANILQNSNVDISSGFIEEGKRKYLARTTGETTSLKELEDLVIKKQGNNFIRLGQISKITLEYEDSNYIVRHLGEDAIALNIIKESGANTIEVQKNLLITMERLNNSILKKEGLYLTNVYTDTTYINNSISVVRNNLIFGAILAIIVLLIFLRSFKSTFIIAIAIPSSVIISFIAFLLLDRTINLISLAGISFAIGMVLDNSLVVLENIFSKIENGCTDIKKAAIEGATEVSGAILASTLTTVAVFVPIFFLSNEIGQLFKDIAISISISVILSLIISITLVPGLASKILTVNPKTKVNSNWISKINVFFQRIGEKFCGFVINLLKKILSNFNRLVKIMLIVLFCSITITYLIFPKTEYLPEGNRNLIISILIPPQGYNIKKIKEIGFKAESKIKKLWSNDYEGNKKISSFFFVARPKSVFMGAVAENPKNIKKLIPELKDAGSNIPGFINIVTQSSLFSRSIGERRAIDINIQGSNYNSIIEVSRILFSKLKKQFPNYQIRPKPSLSNSNPEIIIDPIQLNLKEVNLTVKELGLITNIILDGAKVSKFNLDGKEIDIKLRGNSPNDISSNNLNTKFIFHNGKLFPLNYVSNISIRNSPQQINHIERQRTIKLQISPDESINIESALSELESFLDSNEVKSLILSKELSIELKGITGKLSEAKDSLSKNFIYALIISFFLLASLFQSFLYPLIVLIIVPLSSLGGLIGLKLVNFLIYEPLNMMTMLGFIILLGIVVNNSILIVYQSLNNIRKGLEPISSVISSVKNRIRPIFMTTLTTSFGLLPLAIFSGSGSELYKGLGIVILSGLIISTLFTLLLTPMAIIFMNRFVKLK
ncbi:MAG: efflux RND transporter permease subunit [Thermodesulfobacteriota bacterium]